MHVFQRLFANKSRLTIALLLALCLVVAQVSAASMSCRSDPIIFLSDGTRLQVNTTVQTSADDLNSIVYTVHVPANVTIERINFTPSWGSAKEHVVLTADQPVNTYQIMTVAQTGTANVPTTVTATKVSRANHGEGSTHKEATGLSGQAIYVSF